MSKIFDMLSRGKGEIADAIRPLVEATLVEAQPGRRPHAGMETQADAPAAPEAAEGQAPATLAAVRTLSSGGPANNTGSYELRSANIPNSRI